MRKLWTKFIDWLCMPLTFERGYEDALHAADGMSSEVLLQSITNLSFERNAYDRGWTHGAKYALRLRGWEF